ncbi:MAG TPA: hypothetical protein VGD68_04380 [Streptosporangiaceae bacterium]
MTDMTSEAPATGLVQDGTHGPAGDGVANGRPAYSNSVPAEKSRRRLYTETRPSFKTTEFWIYIAAVVAVLIASDLVGSTAHHADYFRADRAWLYIVVLTVGYLLSRGFAKSGSKQPYDEQ